MCMQNSWLGTEVLIHDLWWYIKGTVHQHIKTVQFFCSEIITNTRNFMKKYEIDDNRWQEYYT